MDLLMEREAAALAQTTAAGPSRPSRGGRIEALAAARSKP